MLTFGSKKLPGRHTLPRAGFTIPVHTGRYTAILELPGRSGSPKIVVYRPVTGRYTTL
jgi:hypothetical protein